MKSLAELLKEKKILQDGIKVGMPLFHEMYVYGYTIANSGIDDLIIDCEDEYLSCLGPVDVYSNRAISKGKTLAIFTSVIIPDTESILLKNAYLPRMIRGKQRNGYYLNHVRRGMRFDTSRVPNTRIDEGVIYYDLGIDDLLFKSNSRMIGVGSSFSVICSRINEHNGEIIYEAYSPNQLYLVK